MTLYVPNVEFDTSNPDPRCACVLVLDTSGSMSGTPIDELNRGLVALSDALKKDALARVRVELAVVTFGPVQVVQDFVLARDYQPVTLDTTGDTPMGAALQKALDIVNDRKEMYKSAGVSYYRPWIFLITDGSPTDAWEHVAKRIKSEEISKKIAFFAVGVAGADMSMLSQLAARQPLKLEGLKFVELFQWLSSSLSNVSKSSVDDAIPLPSPTSWSEV